MTGQLAEAGFLGHAAAAATFLALALFVAATPRRGAFSGLMIAVGSIASGVWAAAVAYDFHTDAVIGPVAQVLEIVRSCGWMVLLLGLLNWIPPVRRSSMAVVIVAICAIVAALTMMNGGDEMAINLDPVLIGGHLALALLGLGLVENLFRNSPRDRYWTIKYLCFGIGGIFAYDFYLYANALLFHEIDPELFIARGVTNLLVTPLLAVFIARDRDAGPQIAVSRRFAFYSATVMGAGLYLLTMAAAGYYVRRFGGTWSGFLQTVFFFGTILLLVVPLSSGSFRAYFRIFVEKSFFKYKYEYRTEWLRFIQTASSTESGQGLRVRVIEAVANIVDSPEGGVWMRREPGRFTLAAKWNLSRWTLDEAETAITADEPLAAFLERKQWMVDLDEWTTRPSRYEELRTLPAWLAPIERAWLILPLLQHDTLIGIMFLGRPRAARSLSWEDFDILKTVARQAASYLAEQAASEALLEARQFEAFNKRFAFVVHDIKNLASQLSLILSNAAKHSGNARFQSDMIETVRQSVDKMNRMLRQLHAQPEESAPPPAVELAPMLHRIVTTRSELGPAITLDLQTEKLAVAADEDRLKAVVEHLVQNAVDAVGADGRVQVRLTGDGGMAVIEIEDNGPGMDAEFVRDRLFHPFSTTKGVGYGIGAYESRDFANSLGGRLDVTSQPGHGTIMRMRLPAVMAR